MPDKRYIPEYGDVRILRSGWLDKYDIRPDFFTVLWNITGRCPYSCSYCYERHLPIRNHEPLLQDLLQAIPRLQPFFRENTPRFRLFGGEPTAHKGFLPLVKALREEIPNARLSCTSNGYHSLAFFERLYSIDPNFEFEMSVHFEKAERDETLKKIDFLAAQRKRTVIYLQFLPAMRDQIMDLAETIKSRHDNAVDVQIQFLRTLESKMTEHISGYTDADYTWARTIQASTLYEPVIFIDYITESGEVIRRTFTFSDAFSPELTNFKGALCTLPMNTMQIDLDGNIMPWFCLPERKYNIFQDTISVDTTLPKICQSDRCTCRCMREAAKYFDSNFAPLHLGGKEENAVGTVDHRLIAVAEKGPLPGE